LIGHGGTNKIFAPLPSLGRRTAAGFLAAQIVYDGDFAGPQDGTSC
jgi:hypothetical protein